MVVIKAKDVWKKYRIYYDRGTTLKEKVLFRKRNRYEDIWVLKGVTLDIEKGWAVGLIGENGSGKSTLLKLFTRIIYPNKGAIEMTGKVASLLELGAGFHPDMTGRENIYTNASIFGLTKEEIDAQLDDIIAFSELEEFIDNPVRTYSSGMYMRLAFAVAINVKADILLIDEILAVGDVNFQKKCFNKLKELKREGTTIVIVSHDLSSIENMCDMAVWLNKGEVKAIGNTKQVIDDYMQYMNRKQEIALEKEHGQYEDQGEQQKNDEGKQPLKSAEAKSNEDDGVKWVDNAKRWGSRDIEIINVTMVDDGGTERHSVNWGDRACIRISYKRHRPVDEHVFGIGITNQDDIHCYGTNTDIDGIEIEEIEDEGIIDFVIDKMTLVEGRYFIDVAAHAKDGRAYDYRRGIYEFMVVSPIKDVGVARLGHEWILK